MNPKKKKFNFTPRGQSSNKEKKKLYIISEYSPKSKDVIKTNLYENNLKNIDYTKDKEILYTDNNNEDMNSELKYLLSANEKENIDFISTFLKLKGIQTQQSDKRNNNTNKYKQKNNNKKSIEKNSKNVKGCYQSKKSNKKEIGKIYNAKTMSSKKKKIKGVTIDLLNSKSQQKIKNKDKSPKRKSFDNKTYNHPKEKVLYINKTKTIDNSKSEKIKIKNINTHGNRDYKKDIENKKRQLLEGKHLNSNIRKIGIFNKANKNMKKNIHSDKTKKIKNLIIFPIIDELEEDKLDTLNIKVYKTKKDNNNIDSRNQEKIENNINKDKEDNQEDNIIQSMTTIKNNNSNISNETLINDINNILLEKKSINKELASCLSSSTFNNDLVNYKSSIKLSYLINKNNTSNNSNTNFSIITNSLLNNNNEDKSDFIIENNSNMIMNDLDDQNDISDTIYLDNKDQIQSKINDTDINKTMSDNSSIKEESIVEQFDINNNQIQNESKEIKFSQINIYKNNTEPRKEIINTVENNTSKNNISITNLSKLTNFVDSKFLDMSHYNKTIDNNNNLKKKYNMNIQDKKEEINIKRIEHKKVKKIIPNKDIINNNNDYNDNYFNINNIEKTIETKEKEPEDRIRKESPKDNYRNKIYNVKTMKNSTKNIFEDDDFSPSKKLVNTNKRDIIYTPTKIIFNNHIYKKNKSKGKTMRTLKLNSDEKNNEKESNKKKYYYTSISPLPKHNFKNINHNISIKNNINNNIIINYKD
mgnify:CR=1 FL=1